MVPKPETTVGFDDTFEICDVLDDCAAESPGVNGGTLPGPPN